MELLTSMEESVIGSTSIEPPNNSSSVYPNLSAFIHASETTYRVISIPMPLPVLPTCLRAREQSNLPPNPKSRTISPSLSDVYTKGLSLPRPRFAPVARASSIRGLQRFGYCLLNLGNRSTPPLQHLLKDQYHHIVA